MAKKTPTLKELRERKLEIRVDLKELLDKKGRKEGDYTETDKQRFNDLTEECDQVNSMIQDIERVQALGFDDDEIRDLSKRQVSQTGLALTASEAEKARGSCLFRTCSKTLSYMETVLDTPQKRFLASNAYNKAISREIQSGRNDRDTANHVRRFLESNESDCPEGVSTADYESGGWLTTPMQMLSGILRCCDRIVKMRSLARIFTVNEAASLGVRKNTGEVSTADWGTECEQPSCSAPTGTVKVLTPHILSACTALCRELIRNTPDGTENYFVESLARAMSEKMEEGYLYGDGLNKPLGILTTDALNSDRYIAYSTEDDTFDGDDLIDILCNIPVCYQGGNLAWMGSQAMWCAIMKLKTQYGYLWSTTSDRGLAVGVPTTLLGYPFMISEFMSSYTPNQASSTGYVPLMLGDWSQYWIADKNSMLMERQVCPGPDRVAWYARFWTDGMPMCDEAFSGIVIVD